MINAKDILNISILEDNALLEKIKSLTNRCGYRPLSDAYSVVPKQDEIYLGSSQYKIEFNKQIKDNIKRFGKSFLYDMRKLCDKVSNIVSSNIWMPKRYVDISHLFVEAGGTGTFPFRISVGFWVVEGDTFGTLGISTYVNTKELSKICEPGFERFRKEFEENLFHNLGFLDNEIKAMLIKEIGK